MKNDVVQICIDFIRFNQDSEGFELKEGTETVIRQILDDEISADTAIQNYIETQNLDTTFNSVNTPFYPETTIQVNYFNIKDQAKLKTVENALYPLRLAELLKNEIPTKYDFDFLKEIHASLFGDIYPNAGCIRKFTASKRIVFCEPQYIEQMADSIFKKLLIDRYLLNKDRRNFINDLAYYMGEMEALHPFVDGNGRAIRVFFHLLATHANYPILWFDIDSNDLLEADISAIDGEYQLLVDVLNDAILDN